MKGSSMTKTTESLHSSLREAFDRIVAHEAFDGSHVSLDRDHAGEMTVNIAPDWLDAVALSFLVTTARELEVSVVITEKGIRLDEQTGEMVRAVDAVKETLRAERERGADDGE